MYIKFGEINIWSQIDLTKYFSITNTQCVCVERYQKYYKTQSRSKIFREINSSNFLCLNVDLTEKM